MKPGLCYAQGPTRWSMYPCKNDDENRYVNPQKVSSIECEVQGITRNEILMCEAPTPEKDHCSGVGFSEAPETLNKLIRVNGDKNDFICFSDKALDVLRQRFNIEK